MFAALRRNDEAWRDRLRDHAGRKRGDFGLTLIGFGGLAGPPSRPSSAAPTHRYSASIGSLIALSVAASS
jgi:hypothetical protein